MRTLTTGRTLPTDISAHFQPMVEFIEAFAQESQKWRLLIQVHSDLDPLPEKLQSIPAGRVRPLFAAAVSVHRRQNPARLLCWRACVFHAAHNRRGVHICRRFSAVGSTDHFDWFMDYFIGLFTSSLVSYTEKFFIEGTSLGSQVHLSSFVA